MSVPTRRVAVSLVLVLTLAPAACGGTNGGGLSAAARTRLAPLVRQIRSAADAHDPSGAQRALTNLERAVAASKRDGEISSTRATQILAAAAQVQNRLGLVPTTTTTTTITTTTTTLPENHGHGKGNKHGDNGGGGGGGD